MDKTLKLAVQLACCTMLFACGNDDSGKPDAGKTGHDAAVDAAKPDAVPH